MTFLEADDRSLAGQYKILFLFSRMTLTDEFKEYLSYLVDELRKSGKATYPNYVEELNKHYDVDQKLGGLIVKLGAGTYVALVFRAENVEEFIKTHGVKYANLQKSYLISDNEIQEFWIGEWHQTHLRKDRDDLWHQLRYVIKLM